MILRNGSFENMAHQIRESDSEIVIFGAGMIGSVTVPALLKEYQLEYKVKFYVDNDSEKWGKNILVSGRECGIFSPDVLKQVNGEKTVIFLTISRFSDCLSQLESYGNLEKTPCFIIPMMCIANFRPSEKKLIKKECKESVIPKVIHYMWLGEKEVPTVLQRCIESWKEFCPDYEICCWNESNYDIGKNLYMKQAYEHGMYGFVPDYARLDILYTHGGIYLDTDVELVKSLDDLLYQEAFCCVEKWQTINFGGGSGSVKNNRAVGELLKARENLLFVDNHGNLNKNTCGYYDTLTMEKHGYRLSGKVQKILGLNIYPYEVFHPYDYMSGRTERSLNTYGIHHFHGGWLDETMKEANRKTSETFEKIFELAGKADI